MIPARPTSRADTRWGLQLKLILSMLLVGVVPLMVGLGLAFWQGSREIQVVNGESFKALAEESARKVDLLISDEVVGHHGLRQTLRLSLSLSNGAMPCWT